VGEGRSDDGRGRACVYEEAFRYSRSCGVADSDVGANGIANDAGVQGGRPSVRVRGCGKCGKKVPKVWIVGD